MESGRKRNVMVLPSMLSFLLFSLVKIQCFDVGTNSIIYLLARVDSLGRLTPLAFYSETTRLGKSLQQKGILSKKSQLLTISAIKKLFLKDVKCIIVGTSALRESKNSTQFVKLLRKETGLNLKILTEQTEADLAFTSANYSLKPLPKKTIICDIGGGSTELIFCNGKNNIKKISIPIGAVKITERFKNRTDLMESFVFRTLQPSINTPKKFKGYNLVGIGGTVTTTAALIQNLKHYNTKKIHKYTISYDKLVKLNNRLKTLSLTEKKNLIRFDPKRADIIVGGITILKTIMQMLNVKKIKVCDRGLVYALARRKIHSGNI